MPAAFNEELGESNLSRLAATSASDTTRDVISHSRTNWILLKEQGNYHNGGTESIRAFKGKGKSGRWIADDDEDLLETIVFLRQRFRDLKLRDQFMTYTGSPKDWTSKRAADETRAFQKPEGRQPKWKLLRTTQQFKSILNKAIGDIRGTWIENNALSDLVRGVIPDPVRPDADDLAALDRDMNEGESDVELVQEDAVSEPEHVSDDDEKRGAGARPDHQRRASRRPPPGSAPVPEPPVLTEEDILPYNRQQAPRHVQSQPPSLSISRHGEVHADRRHSHSQPARERAHVPSRAAVSPSLVQPLFGKSSIVTHVFN